jgi:hypothetical protein
MFPNSRIKIFIRKVVRIQVVQSVWDRRVSFNPGVLAIYLKLVPTFENKARRFDECQCENDNIPLFSLTWVLSNGHYHWLNGLINLMSIKHKV